MIILFYYTRNLFLLPIYYLFFCFFMSSGRQIQRLLPTFLRPLFDPLLGLIFDSKFINLDTEHFKKAVMENVGEYTFQEGELRSHSCLSSLLSSFLFLPLLRSSLPSLPVTLLLSPYFPLTLLPSLPPSYLYFHRPSYPPYIHPFLLFFDSLYSS